MRPVIDPPLLSFINEAESTARALAWVKAGLREMREVEAALAPEIRLMESFRQIREAEVDVAPPTGPMEFFGQIAEAAPTIHQAFAALHTQVDGEREPAAPISPVADSHVAPPAPAPRKTNRGNRKTRAKSIASTAALALYIHGRSLNPKLTQRNLAQRATDFAAKHGLPGADLLNPESSTMRDLAAGILAGWEAMQKVAAHKPRRLPPRFSGGVS